jgi:hypothetical protein
MTSPHKLARRPNSGTYFMRSLPLDDPKGSAMINDEEDAAPDSSENRI